MGILKEMEQVISLENIKDQIKEIVLGKIKNKATVQATDFSVSNLAWDVIDKYYGGGEEGLKKIGIPIDELKVLVKEIVIEINSNKKEEDPINKWAKGGPSRSSSTGYSPWS